MAPRSTGRTQKRIFYKIGEVCELTKTEPYVLRYWESEFPFLAPEKNRSGQRIYSDDDIQMVLAIKRLLYDEGYTTAGARRRLEKEIGERQAGGDAGAETSGGTTAETSTTAASQVAAAATGEDLLRPALRSLREGLLEIRSLLGGEPETPPAPRGRRR